MGVSQWSFEDRLAFSQGKMGSDAMETIKALIPDCETVEPSTLAQDIKGIDYIAILDSGVALKIDHKVREHGCSKYWKTGPELALETWSIYGRKLGWTLDKAKDTDYTLHTFDASDTEIVYLLPFQLLRKAFRKHGGDWSRQYGTKMQHSRNNGREWDSECVFVPATIVLDAIKAMMQGRREKAQ